MATNSFQIPLPGYLLEPPDSRLVGHLATEHHTERGTSRRERSSRI
jgi:hypothetical protein